MSKYIDADKVIDYANQEVTAAFYYPQDAQEQTKQDEQAHRDKWAFIKQVMIGTPAADVAELRCGKWEKGKCSVCGFDWHNIQYEKTKVNRSPYCPNCGAKMRK